MDNKELEQLLKELKRQLDALNEQIKARVSGVKHGAIRP